MDMVTDMSLNHQKCHWIQYVTFGHPAAFRTGRASKCFGTCESRTMPDSWVWKLGLARLVTDGLKRETNLSVCVRASAHPRKVWSKRLVSFKIYALSVLSFVGSVAEPDTATVAAENLALQRLSAGPFYLIPSALHPRGSTCGLDN